MKLDEIEGKATVVAWSNYFATIKFNVTGSFKLEVQGYRYKIVEKYATVSLNARGKTVKWKNPLISNTTMANELAALRWLIITQPESSTNTILEEIPSWTLPTLCIKKTSFTMV